MELEILHAIQGLHAEWLNPIMIFLSKIGEAGICWIVLSIVLMIFKKTRKCGITMAISMLITYIIANLCLKNLIARPRPCAVDNSVELLVAFPKEFSFPSGHTSNGFAASVVIFLYNKKWGLLAILIAATIAFSRLYLFVHYPTDILAGIVIGTMDAIISFLIIRKYIKI